MLRFALGFFFTLYFACTSAPPMPEGNVELRRTLHGVVHVQAEDFHGIGFGVGYAFAQDNRCLLIRRIIEVRGGLSEQLGADADVVSVVHDLHYSALQSDHFYRGWFDIKKIRRGFSEGKAEVRELAKGYADGVNRWNDSLSTPSSCELELKERVTTDDVYRIWVATAALASGEFFAGRLPHSLPSASASNTPEPNGLNLQRQTSLGSNAWAIGKDGTKGANSVHLYNPHFPWSGPQRLYMIHVTIPGQLDVMGAALSGFPLPFSGFTEDVAWGLTFSPAARWSLEELALVGDMKTYRVDHHTHEIKSELISIPVKGENEPRKLPFFRAEDDPIIDAPDMSLAWTAARVFAAHDANSDNTRMVEQLLGVAQSSTVRELHRSLESIQGVPWSYTLASDSSGEVYFGDVSSAPGINANDLSRCVTSFLARSMLLRSIIILDGSNGTCSWEKRMSAEDQPFLFRSDYVANSNNNYERVNLAAPLKGFSPILSLEGEALSLRANLGLTMISERLEGSDGLGSPGFTGALARSVFDQDRNRAGELLVDGIVDDCTTTPRGMANGVEVNIGPACDALSGWDRRNTITSRGAAVFRGVWMILGEEGDPMRLFAVPASFDAPLGTPSGYTSDSELRRAVRDALALVTTTLESKGIPLDQEWGEVHKMYTPSGSLPLPGGLESEGIFDVLSSSKSYYSFEGWLESLSGIEADTLFGASYLHIVEFADNEVNASGVLAYSQSTDPESPWYFSQAEAWSSSSWFEFPFTNEEIEADLLEVTDLAR